MGKANVAHGLQILVTCLCLTATADAVPIPLKSTPTAEQKADYFKATGAPFPLPSVCDVIYKVAIDKGGSDSFGNMFIICDPPILGQPTVPMESPEIYCIPIP